MNIVRRALEFIGNITKIAILSVAGVITLFALHVASTATYTPDGDYSASIVKVLNVTGNGGGTGWATRTSTGRKVVVTNDHVCEVAVNGYVVLEEQGGKKSIKGILARSFERDLCVIEGLEIPALDLASRGPRRFDKITVIGHPLLNPTTPAYGQYVADGIMAVGFSPEEDGTCRGGELMSTDGPQPPSFGVPFIAEPRGMFGSVCVLHMELSYTTVSIYPGNSGSPVTNEDGDVIGVINSAFSRDNRGNFIPLIYVKEILEE